MAASTALNLLAELYEAHPNATPAALAKAAAARVDALPPRCNGQTFTEPQLAAHKAAVLDAIVRELGLVATPRGSGPAEPPSAQDDAGDHGGDAAPAATPPDRAKGKRSRKGKGAGKGDAQ